MLKRENISLSVIKRVPRYYRFLTDLKKSGMERISSKELSARMGLTASQIRQDLNCFGEFGQQGYGYNVTQLQHEIAEILGLHEAHKTILIGAGNLGRSVASYMLVDNSGYKLIGVFDNKESVCGGLVQGLPVRHVDRLDEFCRENLPEAAVLTLPTEAAPDVVSQLVSLGIKGIWNFTHFDISFHYPDLAVENVHLSDSLMTLCYKMKDKD